MSELNNALTGICLLLTPAIVAGGCAFAIMFWLVVAYPEDFISQRLRDWWLEIRS